MLQSSQQSLACKSASLEATDLCPTKRPLGAAVNWRRDKKAPL